MKVDFIPSSLMDEAVGNIRNKTTDSMQFRRNLKKIGRYLAYEASKSFKTIDYEIETPLTITIAKKGKYEIVIISVLRAALPMVDGVLEEFETASLGIVSAARGNKLNENGTEFEIEASYSKIPSLDNKIAIIIDPMLATGSTIRYLLNLIDNEKPIKIVLLCAIASEFGIDVIASNHPEVELYAAAIDPELNNNGYIVPGLGDAGDRAFNTQH